MATSRATVPVSWDNSHKVEATEDTAYLIKNTDDLNTVYWIVGDTNVPTFDINAGHEIKPGKQQPVTLKTGEFLWTATGGNEIQVTITSGAA